MKEGGLFLFGSEVSKDGVVVNDVKAFIPATLIHIKERQWPIDLTNKRH